MVFQTHLNMELQEIFVERAICHRKIVHTPSDKNYLWQCQHIMQVPDVIW